MRDLISNLQGDSLQIRRRCLQMALMANNATHIGGGLSTVEIFTVLYGHRMISNGVSEVDRDRFILSKGHGVLSFFATLNYYQIIDDTKIATFMTNGSDLIAHPIMNPTLGIESSNGSLGQGLSLACGIAIAKKRKSSSAQIFTLVGDGECDEGMIWEAAMFASHHKLDNLTCIVDMNGFQSDGTTVDVMNSTNMAHKWMSFGWHTVEVEGHDLSALVYAFNLHAEGKPVAVIAKTTKGKGISFMENDNTWHHNKLTQSLYLQAVQELDSHENS